MEPIKNPEVERLAFTLRNSGIAFSESEARRMAQNMVSTEKKVQTNFENFRAENEEEMENRKRQMMGALPPKPEVEDTPEPEPEQAEDLEIKEVDEEAVKQENIEKLRENAIESKPVEIQVDYETPKKAVTETEEIPDDVSLKELMDEDAEKVYAEDEKQLPEEVHEDILENKPTEKYNYQKPELEEEKPAVVELEEVKEATESGDSELQSEIEATETKEEPAKKIDTSEEEKVDLSNMFNFSNR